MHHEIFPELLILNVKLFQLYFSFAVSEEFNKQFHKIIKDKNVEV
jgi:hypothetical protein